MEDNHVAKDVGQRLKRFRMAKGMSMQELADKIPTSAQNVSNWEKRGISNVDTIIQLSKILGQDLMTDERDEEGTVGVVGNEILRLLTEREGVIPFKEFVKDKLHGMSAERVTNEIFKLEKIGMVVRKQYTDFYDKEQDAVYITAKGLIASGHQAEESVRTYEERLKNPHIKLCAEEYQIEARNIQEYIDSRPYEKLIRQFNPQNGYRINYIVWMKKVLETSNVYMEDKEEFCRRFDSMVAGEGIYHDILFEMALGLSREDLDDSIEYGKLIDQYLMVLHDNLMNIDPKLDEIQEKTFNSFLGQFQSFYGNNYSETSWMVDLDEPFVEERKSWTDFHKQYLKQYRELIIKRIEEIKKENKNDYLPEQYFSHVKKILDLVKDAEQIPDTVLDPADVRDSMNERLEKNSRIKEVPDLSPYPWDWFSISEIREFIDKNLLPAETEYEQETDELLKQINRQLPTERSYYRYPKIWISGGIQEKINSIYHFEQE